MSRLKGIVLVVTTIAAAVAFQSPYAQGQITLGVASTDVDFSYAPNGGSVLTHNENATATTVVLGSQGVLLSLTGDFDLALPRQTGIASVDVFGTVPFTVGNLPVQIGYFGLSANAKWVAGGGSATAPNTTQGSVYGWLYEQLGAAPAAGDPLVATAGTGLVANFTGNGYQIAGPASFAGQPSSYVFAAGRTYYLQIDDYTFSDNTTWNINMPSVTITNEFGGTFGDGFAGFTAGFLWAAVPEPSTLTLASLAGLSLVGLGFRRRSGATSKV